MNTNEIDTTSTVTTRDRQIIEHAARYRVTTNEVIHELFFPENRPNAVTKVTARLCAEDWLRNFPLLYPRQYFLPGKRTARILGLPITRTHPLGPQSLPTEYAVLCYSVKAKAVKRLLPQELSDALPWYREEWLASPHCVRPAGGCDCIELLRIDLGGAADYVARKCMADIRRRLTSMDFIDAIEKGEFRLVVITATTDKAAATQLALEGKAWPTGLAFHLVVVPELLPLLPRCIDAT